MNSHKGSVMVDPEGRSLNEFKNSLMKWKTRNIEFFNNILTYKKYMRMKKSLGDKKLVNKMKSNLSAWIIIYELCIQITSPYFGVIISNLDQKEKIYKNCFYVIDLVNWLEEILDLENREQAFEITKILYDYKIINPKNFDKIENIDSITSICNFDQSKIISLQRYLSIKSSWQCIFHKNMEDDDNDENEDGDEAILGMNVYDEQILGEEIIHSSEDGEKDNTPRENTPRENINLLNSSLNQSPLLSGEKNNPSINGNGSDHHALLNNSCDDLIIPQGNGLKKNNFLFLSLNDKLTNATNSSSSLGNISQFTSRIMNNVPSIEFEDDYKPHIHNNFYNVEFDVYAAKFKNKLNGFILVEKIPKRSFDQSSKRKVMIVTEAIYKQAHLFHIPMLGKDKKEIKLRAEVLTLELIKTDLRNDLFEFERKMIENTKRYKFGVIYVKEGQENDENLIFSNNETTPQLEKFLEQLGQKIRMKGWEKYAGGLNTKEDSTGEYSYYNHFHEFQIMFHVTTMLPDDKFDPQRVAKKKHTGNDIVVIIFSESKDLQFDPKVLTSQFNHVFIIVTIEKIENDKTYYKLNVFSKPGVSTIPPPLPKNPVFVEGEQFSQFLLTKLINAERAAMYAPDFNKRLKRTRRLLLGEIANKISKNYNLQDRFFEDQKFRGEVLFNSEGCLLKKKEKSPNSSEEEEKPSKKLQISSWIEPMTEKDWIILKMVGTKYLFGKNQAFVPHKDNVIHKVIKGTINIHYGKTLVQTVKEGKFVNFSNLDNKFTYTSSEHNTELLILTNETNFTLIEKYSKVARRLFENLSVEVATLIKNISNAKDLKSDKLNEMLNVSEKEIVVSKGEHQKTFENSFMSTEILIDSFSCFCKKFVSFEGRLYISSNLVCFSGKVFQKEVKRVIEMRDITSIKTNKESNYLEIFTTGKTHKFSGFVNIENCSQLIVTLSSKSSENNFYKDNGINYFYSNNYDFNVYNWEYIFSFSKKKHFKKGDLIIKENTHDDHLFYISRGSCLVSKMIEGNDVLLNLLPTGVFFGEVSFLLDSNTPFTVTCVDDCEIFSIAKKDLIVILDRSSLLAAKFFRGILDILCERFVSLLTRNIK